MTGVGNAGVSVQAVPWLRFHANFDQGFRAPNLDDLTSRQQTGPGFQFENADLDPERSISLEGGLQVKHPWIELEGVGLSDVDPRPDPTRAADRRRLPDG